MKTTCGNIVLTLIALLVSSVSANDTPNMFVLTIFHAEEPLSQTEIQALNTAMVSIGPELDLVVEETVADGAVPLTRNLRVENNRRLACTRACEYYVSTYTQCYVNGLMMDRCPPRALTMHEDLSEEDVAHLNEDDRRRHLEMSTLCKEATTGISSVIGEAELEGLLPTPDGMTRTEKCYYYFP